MATSVEIIGFPELLANLTKLEVEAILKTGGEVVVGFTAAYAVYVHENVAMKLKGKPRTGKGAKGKYWDPQGKAQAKFLESPFRSMKNELVNITALAVAKGASLQQGLYIAGLRLQREAMERTPVDTGNLKASAFTEKSAKLTL